MAPFLLVSLCLIAIVLLLLTIDPLRQRVLSRPLLRLFRRVLPPISDTENDALAAGTVWWEGELFSGNPDWSKLHSYPKPALTAEEQAFLDNEVSVLCDMIDDWRIVTHDYNLPPQAWQYLK